MARELKKKAREKYGRVYGEELKEIVLEHFNEPWGPRYLTTPVPEPYLEHLTPTVLRGIL